MVNPRYLALLCAITAVALVGIACADNTQEIRDANEAAAAGESSDVDQGLSQRISVFDLRVGDCYNSPDLSALGDGESTEAELVELVLCSSDHEFKVLRNILLDHEDGADYPGEVFFDDVFFDECPPGANFYLFPIEDSWSEGDRVVNCIEAR